MARSDCSDEYFENFCSDEEFRFEPCSPLFRRLSPCSPLFRLSPECSPPHFLLLPREHPECPCQEREAYRAALDNGSIEVAYGRVMILGPGDAGKSSLKKGLMGQSFYSGRNSTNVVDYLQGRPVHREWVREGLVWNEVTEEDETEELAQFMVLAKQSGSHKVDEHIHSSYDADCDHYTSFLQEVHEIANVHIVNPAMAKSKNLVPEDIHLQPFLYLWDCGSQPVFLEVLPAFLTLRTMFLLVFDASKSLKERMPSLHYCDEEGQRIHHGMTNTTTLQLMEKWMTNIHAYLVKVDEKGVAEGYPQINVIGTRGDLLSSEEKREKEKELVERFGHSLFNEIVQDYMIINNTTAGTDTEDENFTRLRKQVHDFVTNCLKVKTPVKWALFRKVLQMLVAQKSYKILTFNEISSIATSVCKIDPEHVVSMLNFYHELGVLLYYPNVENLRDKIILSPLWLVKCLSKVLTLPGHGVAGGHRMKMEWDLLQSRGILVEPLYTVAWHDCNGISPEGLIDLMVSFHLAAKVEMKIDGYPRSTIRKYFVPCVLQYKPPPHIKPLNFPIQSCAVAPLHVTFTTGYVVPGFFVRLAAVMAESPEFSLYFNDGIYHDFVKYSFSTSRAITVSLTDITHAIQISIDSTLANPHSWFERDCAVLLDLIPKFCLKVENALHSNDFAGFEKRGISLSEMKSELHIVCQGEECQTKDKPHYLVGTPVDGQIYCTEGGQFRKLVISEKYWFIENRDTIQVSSPQCTDSVIQPRPHLKKHNRNFSGSQPAVKPIVSELCSELVKLVDWENTVIHLPAMSRAETRKVKQSEPIVDQQKQKAFDIWLKKCPEASWSHVRDALHKAGEFILEREVAEKYSLPLLAESIPMREVFSSQTNFTTDGTIGDHQLNLHPQFPGLDPLPIIPVKDPQSSILIPDSDETQSASPKKFTESATQFDSAVSMCDLTHKGVVVEEQLFLAKGGNQQYYEWEECGLFLYIPENAISPLSSCEVRVSALAGGDFIFPDDYQLVSAVYAVTFSHSLQHPIAIELQHCVDLQTHKHVDLMSFAVALPLPIPGSYKFNPIGGRFNVGDRFGSIEASKSLCYCIILRECISEAGNNGSCGGQSNARSLKNEQNDHVEDDWKENEEGSDSGSGEEGDGGAAGGDGGSENSSSRDDEQPESETNSEPKDDEEKSDASVEEKEVKEKNHQVNDSEDVFQEETTCEDSVGDGRQNQSSEPVINCETVNASLIPVVDDSESIDIEAVVSCIKEEIHKKSAALKSLFDTSIEAVSANMSAAGLISHAVMQDPCYESIIKDVNNHLMFVESLPQILECCEKFFKALLSLGGPFVRAQKLLQKNIARSIQGKLNFKMPFRDMEEKAAELTRKPETEQGAHMKRWYMCQPFVHGINRAEWDVELAFAKELNVLKNHLGRKVQRKTDKRTVVGFRFSKEYLTIEKPQPVGSSIGWSVVPDLGHPYKIYREVIDLFGQSQSPQPITSKYKAFRSLKPESDIFTFSLKINDILKITDADDMGMDLHIAICSTGEGKTQGNDGEVDSPGDSTILDKKPILKHAVHVLRGHSTEWSVIGLELDVPSNERDGLRRDTGLSNIDRLEKVIDYWLKKECHTPVTWSELIEILEGLSFTATVRSIQEEFLKGKRVLKAYMKT